MTIFTNDGDFEAFEQVLLEAVERSEMRLLAYCILPNHWHLVVWPKADGALSRFGGWLSLTHTQRWHAHRRSIGSGHVYQGRFKSFPIEEDQHFLAVARYVERNALRAGLVRNAEAWRWCSLFRWLRSSAEDKRLLSAWPVPRSAGWVEHVNRPQTEAEVAAIVHSIRRGSPFGDDSWTAVAARRLNLLSTLAPRGRPRKPEKGV